MSGRKNNLLKYQTVTNGDMSQASITSVVTGVQHLDCIGIQLNWTGSPVGTFQVQISIDYERDINGNVINPGNWVPMELDPAPDTASGSPVYIDILQTSAPWIRVVYTRVSGSGTLQAYISAKQK